MSIFPLYIIFEVGSQIYMRVMGSYKCDGFGLAQWQRSAYGTRISFYPDCHVVNSSIEIEIWVIN